MKNARIQTLRIVSTCSFNLTKNKLEKDDKHTILKLKNNKKHNPRPNLCKEVEASDMKFKKTKDKTNLEIEFLNSKNTDAIITSMSSDLGEFQPGNILDFLKRVLALMKHTTSYKSSSKKHKNPQIF